MKKTIAFSLLATVTLVVANGCATSGMKGPSFTKQAQPSFEQELSLARLAERHSRGSQASTIYKKVLEQNPDNQMAHHRLGVMAAKAGNLTGAQEHLQKAASLGQPSAALLADLGYASYLQGEYSAAEQHLAKSLELDSSNKTARNNLGLALAHQQKMDEALQQFRLGGTEAQASANLAYVQSRIGMLDVAEANYHRALNTDPSLKPAAEGLLQLAAASKKRSLAQANAKSAVAKADGQRSAVPQLAVPKTTVAKTTVGKTAVAKPAFEKPVVAKSAVAEFDKAKTAVASKQPESRVAGPIFDTRSTKPVRTVDPKVTSVAVRTTTKESASGEVKIQRPPTEQVVFKYQNRQTISDETSVRQVSGSEPVEVSNKSTSPRIFSFEQPTAPKVNRAVFTPTWDDQKPQPGARIELIEG